jgi:hypothetical protein
MTAFSSWNAEGAGGRREDADGRDLRSVGGRHLDTTPVRRDRDGRGSTMVLVRLNPGRRRTDARSGYEYGEDVARDPGSPSRRPAHEGVTMSDKSPRKGNQKKQGKTLKEKQAAKKTKRIMQAGKSSNIPPTGH